MTAKYYVVFENGQWKVLVSEPFASGSDPTTLRTFETKQPAVAHGKRIARNQGEKLMVNYRDGRTGQAYYDYS